MSTHNSLLPVLMVILAASSSLSQNPSNDSLTVEQAVQLALTAHPALDQARQGVIAATARVEQSRSSLYPEIKAEALYSRISPVPEIGLPGGPAFEIAPEDNYNAHVILKETAYDFGKRQAGSHLAEANWQSAVDQTALTEFNLAYRTIETFYAILYLRENLKVLDEQIEALGRHLEVTQKKVQTGSATDFDVLTTSVRVAAAQTARLDVETSLQRQEYQLRQLMGAPPDQPLRLSGNFDTAPMELNPDSLMQAARDRLPELRQARDAETSADLRMRAASLGMKPWLSVNLDFGFKNGYPSDLNALKANWIAGLQLQAPLFNGFLTRNQEQEARAGLRAAQDHTRDLERQVQAGVLQAIAEMRGAQGKVLTSQPRLEQAQRAVTLARARYAAGVATNLDLLDAQTALADAELASSKALYDLKMSHHNLEKSVGRKVW